MPLRFLLLAAVAVLSFNTHAKRFRNAYVSFELPPNWNCKLEGSEWVCENDFSQKTKEAIIILTAKEVGPSDTLPAYLAHLQTPRAIQGRGGQNSKSQVIHVKERIIGGQMWVDGMHLGSEVGPYFTRYLATIKERISILVTFSAHKQHYTKYSADFIKAVESLKVVATKDTLGNRGGGDLGSGSGRLDGPIGAPIGQNIPSMESELPGEARGAGSKYSMLIWIAVILGAIGVYLYMKSGKPTQPTKKKPSGKK